MQNFTNNNGSHITHRNGSVHVKQLLVPFLFQSSAFKNLLSLSQPVRSETDSTIPKD